VQLSTGQARSLPGRWLTAGRFPESCADHGRGPSGDRPSGRVNVCGSKGAALGRRRLLLRCRSSRTKNRPASEAQQRPERAVQLSTGQARSLPGRWVTAGRFPESCADHGRELLQRPAARPDGFQSDRRSAKANPFAVRYRASGARRPKAGDVRIEARRAKTWRAFGQGLVHESRPPKGARMERKKRANLGGTFDSILANIST